MNVHIITAEDPFYLYEFFCSFYARADESDYHLSAITILKPFNKATPLALARQMFRFYGPLRFARMCAWYILRKLTGKTVGRLARERGLELLRTRDVNDPDYAREIRQRHIDIIVSIASPQIFGPQLLQAVPLGCINSHSALLPENRGMMPVFWAMFKGDAETGVTIHYIDEKIDRGDIVKQERVAIGGASLHEMMLATKRISARLVDLVLREIAARTVVSIPMSPGGSYQSFPTRNDVRQFEKRGRQIF